VSSVYSVYIVSVLRVMCVVSDVRGEWNDDQPGTCCQVGTILHFPYPHPPFSPQLYGCHPVCMAWACMEDM